ncbi:MAG: acetylglutamate kinase, partial [Terriglobales bacterium]
MKPIFGGGSGAAMPFPRPATGGRITVVKIGGSILFGAGPNAAKPSPQRYVTEAPGRGPLEPQPGTRLEPSLVEAVARARQRGEGWVLVHGGGKALTGLLGRLGVETEFRQGLRVTTPAALQAAVMALAGEVNTALVAALNAGGVAAVGLTGLDGGCMQARRAGGEMGAVGLEPRAEGGLMRRLLDAGYTPVLASLASDGAGGVLNVNADLFAAAIAGALGAERLLFATDVAGVLDASGAALATASVGELAALRGAGILRGGMLPKADACRAALAAGVS